MRTVFPTEMTHPQRRLPRREGGRKVEWEERPCRESERERERKKKKKELFIYSSYLFLALPLAHCSIFGSLSLSWLGGRAEGGTCSYVCLFLNSCATVWLPRARRHGG